MNCSMIERSYIKSNLSVEKFMKLNAQRIKDLTMNNRRKVKTQKYKINRRATNDRIIFRNPLLILSTNI